MSDEEFLAIWDNPNRRLWRRNDLDAARSGLRCHTLTPQARWGAIGRKIGLIRPRSCAILLASPKPFSWITTWRSLIGSRSSAFMGCRDAFKMPRLPTICRSWSGIATSWFSPLLTLRSDCASSVPLHLYPTATSRGY